MWVGRGDFLALLFYMCAMMAGAIDGWKKNVVKGIRRSEYGEGKKRRGYKTKKGHSREPFLLFVLDLNQGPSD